MRVVRLDFQMQARVCEIGGGLFGTLSFSADRRWRTGVAGLAFSGVNKGPYEDISIM